MMNGLHEPSMDPHLRNGRATGSPYALAENATKILKALELVHDPRSLNEVRQNASQYLELVRTQNDAPHHGYVFAADKSNPAVARHYGLSLIEHAIRYRWADYSETQSRALREWVWKLAQSVAQEDPAFLRNKIAQLWVELAKRSWVLDWIDMDELLVVLWAGSLTQKQLVLRTLENLSDDAFGRDDITSGQRGNELNRACIEIFTPLQVLVDHMPQRAPMPLEVRQGEEGWIMRIVQFLTWCNSEGSEKEQLKDCIVAGLGTLRSILHSVFFDAITATPCVQTLCRSLLVPDTRVQIAAVEALHTLYNRISLTDDDVRSVVRPMFDSDTIDVLRRVYLSMSVDVSDIDHDKYNLTKKFSELIHIIGKYPIEFQFFLKEPIDLNHFLDLLILVLEHDSLHVTIPILHLWTKYLNHGRIGSSREAMSRMGILLEICSRRLLRYEALPEDSNFPAIVFLNEDVDTMPERHAFLGNYARYCNDVVRSIVAQQPSDAITHILSQADAVLSSLYDGQARFDPRHCSKISLEALKIDAALSVVDAALKGYTRRKKPQIDIEENADAIESRLEGWCTGLMDRRFEDPFITHRIIQTVAAFANELFHRNVQFKTRIIDFLTTFTSDLLPDQIPYNEAVQEVRAFSIQQTQRLAVKRPDEMVAMYDYVEQRLKHICEQYDLNPTEKYRCSAILFSLILRASSIDEAERRQRLQAFLAPLSRQWQDGHLSQSLQSFEGFCGLLGMGSLQHYLSARKVHQIPNWAGQPLDGEGETLRNHLQSALEQLPIQATKTFLDVSVDFHGLDPRAPNRASSLWSDLLPIILPNLLQLIDFAHSFHDPAKWTELPLEMRHVVTRILTDRFWQVGISTGSRDDFYAKIGESRQSLEGLASGVRASLRKIRETSYRVLFYMAHLGSCFYSHSELAEPLARALFGNSHALSVHQTAILVNVMPTLIFNCPTGQRPRFVPPLMVAMFSELDRKVTAEWATIEERKHMSSPDADLTSEMKDESILRQLTYSSVGIVADFLDPQRDSPPTENHGLQNPPQVDVMNPNGGALRRFILGTPETFKPLILFCIHALRMRDTRSCLIITRVIRSLVHEFNGSTTLDADVREFLSTEVLKACITSIHEPYFVDVHEDLAGLIASIVFHYSPRTETPKQILLSLPDMPEERVDLLIKQTLDSHADRHKRANILDFLKGLRGVSIGEQGRLPKASGNRVRTALQQQYMTVEPRTQAPASPELGGIADMFS